MYFSKVNSHDEQKVAKKIAEYNLKFVYDKLDNLDEEIFTSQELIKYVEILTRYNIRVKEIDENGKFEAVPEVVKCQIYKESKMNGFKVLTATENVKINTFGSIIDDGILCHVIYSLADADNPCIDYHIVGKNINNMSFDIDVQQVEEQDFGQLMELISMELHGDEKTNNKVKQQLRIIKTTK